jgi:hypothetical protein
MKLLLKHSLVSAALSTCAAVSTAGADVAAVVSAKSTVPALTQAEVADIFLGRSNRFPDGSQAVPCDLAEGSPVRDEFYIKVVGKSAAQMKAYWSKIIFTGRGQPPRAVGNSEQAKKLVADNPQFVCYIDRNAADKSVNILLTR